MSRLYVTLSETGRRMTPGFRTADFTRSHGKYGPKLRRADRVGLLLALDELETLVSLGNMTYEEFCAIPSGALVEFEVQGDDQAWQGWLASRPFGVMCEGGPVPDHGCVVVHTEPIAFYCVDIQVTSADWPYEDPHPQYGTESALVPIPNVLRVVEMHPPETQPEWYA